MQNLQGYNGHWEGMVKGQGRTETRTTDLWPKEKQRKGIVSGELQFRSPTLLLPQKQPLNSHFSHTILRRFPQPKKQRQLETINTTSRKKKSPFRLTTIHFRSLHRPPRLSYTWKSEGEINSSEKAGLLPLPAPVLLRLAMLPWATGLRLRDGPGSQSHLVVGGSSSPFPSAGGRLGKRNRTLGHTGLSGVQPTPANCPNGCEPLCPPSVLPPARASPFQCDPGATLMDRPYDFRCLSLRFFWSLRLCFLILPLNSSPAAKPTEAWAESRATQFGRGLQIKVRHTGEISGSLQKGLLSHYKDCGPWSGQSAGSRGMDPERGARRVFMYARQGLTRLVSQEEQTLEPFSFVRCLVHSFIHSANI